MVLEAALLGYWCPALNFSLVIIPGPFKSLLQMYFSVAFFESFSELSHSITMWNRSCCFSVVLCGVHDLNCFSSLFQAVKHLDFCLDGCTKQMSGMPVVLKLLWHWNDHKAEEKYLRMKDADIEGERSKPQMFTSIILCYISRTWKNAENQASLC